MRRLAAAVALAALACSDANSPGGQAPPAEAPAAAGDLQITHLVEGTGPSPQATSVVVVHYEGTFEDGQVFDSSIQRGQPARFPLNRVIQCWRQGIPQLKVGGKAELVCPPEIAYGARGMPPHIPPNATLRFQVELIGIE
jgi:FKBP-type peptidyl-prolyl cis-trans isomerase FkpA